MKERCLSRIPEYVLGVLPDEEMREMTTRVTSTPELEAELALFEEALSKRTEALPPMRPSAAVRDRLLATLTSVDRFRPFLGKLSKMVDQPDDVLRGLLSRMDDGSLWEPGPLPGVHVAHFTPGPRSQAVEAGFVRVAAGFAIPRHRHLGDELSFVLEGTLCEDGVRHFPGQILENARGTVHGFSAGGERDLVFVVTHSGFEFL
ncbi:MAG: cupin domain-containing protein [Polyangiaceae bacterium]